MPTNFLALGGLAAVIAAGWTQVKNIFSYLSSFIIVHASLDDRMTHIVRKHLRQEWRLLPSGMLIYMSDRMNFKGQSHSMAVPFRVPANSCIYVKGKKVLFISGSMANMKITFLRGTLNLDTVIGDMVRAYNDEDADLGNNGPVKYDRFYIEKVTGREKGSPTLFDGDSRMKNDTTQPAQSANGGISSDIGVDLNVNLDKSFLYDKSCWDFTAVEDPFASLYYPEHVNIFIEQAIRWITMAKWYSDRAIPWRRGWLLHGGPGTGKTSLAKATAQKLGIPIYQFYLSTLSDQEFIKAWENMSTPCVALLEDFDSVFVGRTSTTEHKSLTYDCILNQISGVATTNGVFLMVTTNCLDKIDPAMGGTWGVEEDNQFIGGVSARPGRVDSVIYLGAMDEPNRRKLAHRVLVDYPDSIEQVVASGVQASAVQFQEMCVQFVLGKLHDEELERIKSVVVDFETPQLEKA